MNKVKSLLIHGAVAAGVVAMQPVAALAKVKNIVLVHGANVDGSTWRDVYDRLTAETTW